jgi:hypothetical protein
MVLCHGTRVLMIKWLQVRISSSYLFDKNQAQGNMGLYISFKLKGLYNVEKVIFLI